MPHSPKPSDPVKPFVKFPMALLEDPRISCGAKTMYALLKMHEPNGGGRSWPSHARLARFLGCHIDRVAFKVKELVAAGWLRYEKRPGTTGHYTTLDHPEKQRNQPPRKTTEPSNRLPTKTTEHPPSKQRNRN